jgi:hypothetical protein
MAPSNHMTFGVNDTLDIKIIDTGNKFIKVHPKNQFHSSVSTAISIITKRFGRSVFIYPTQTTMVLTLNNYFYKVWDDFFTNVHCGSEDVIFKNNLYNGWNVDRNIPHSEIHRWILREFLSLYLVPAWNDLMDWELFDPLNEPNIYLITVDELLFDFSNTISNLTAEFNIPYENVKEIHDIHSEMLSLQEHKNKDEVTSTIIDAFLNDIDYDYSDITLSLVDEVWIQYSLRENGHELLCDGLNKFPKTVKELRKKSFQV